MHKILLVDDSKVDRKLLTALLQKGNCFEVDACNDGRQALAYLAEHRPDVVVTDMIMPVMDGLELVKAIRRQHLDLPVILITGQGSETLAAQALREGAAGYVAKSDCNKLLRDTIGHVLEMSHAASDYERLLGTATQNHFEFELNNDPALIPPLRDLAQNVSRSMGLCDATGCLQVGVAIEHAVANAMFHGNLELPSEDLATLRGPDTPNRRLLLVRRRSEHPFCHRRAHVTLHFTPDEAIFQIRDEGQGFNVHDASSAGLETFLRGGQGQGLLLMWAFMDKVAFNQSGNTVSLRKTRKSLRDSRAAKKLSPTKPESLPEPASPLANLGSLVETSDPSKSIVLSRRRVTIGRAESCDIVIQSSSISHHHCLLYLHQGWWFVKDLQSTNRTKVNQLQVSQHLLRPGDTLSIGKLEFQIEYHPHELGAEGITPPVDPF